MTDFQNIFDERLNEIEDYLDLLTEFDEQVREGSPGLGVQRQRVLYSSVYLQLYNLVEATISLCIEALSAAILSRDLKPGDLIPDLRREWVRSTARTHTDLNYENRLASAVSLCEYLVQGDSIQTFEIERGGGGNWDDCRIEDVAKRLGFPLQIDQQVVRGVKQPYKNDQGALAYIRTLRNKLAHGNVSFAECGSGVTVGDLRELKELTACYLRAVISFFQAIFDGHAYLVPEQR